MKKRIVLLLLVLIFLGLGGYFYYEQFLKPQVVHYHAGFQVYVDGKLQDFSGLKYMHVVPCTTDDHKAEVDEQEEKAHLHDFVGEVAHVHRSNATWGDLFTNIKFRVDSSKSVVAYVNGEKVDGILHYPIKAYDSLVLFIGKHGDVEEYLKKAVKKEYVQKVEKKSDGCGES